MQSMNNDSDNLNEVTYILAFCFFGATFIYMVVNSVCFCCTRHQESACYKANTIIYSGIFMLLGLAMMAMVAINTSILRPKYESLTRWADYANCVDSYMQVTAYQVDFMSTASSSALT